MQTQYQPCLKWAAFAVIALLLISEPSNATEKYWIAHEATLIVVGSLATGLTFPWFDGWHVTGTINVDEVLYGRRPADQIKFRFVCSGTCRLWPPPSFSEFTEKGLWFLRPADPQTWESASGFPDPGFRYLSQRADFENYIRRYKCLMPMPAFDPKRTLRDRSMATALPRHERVRPLLAAAAPGRTRTATALNTLLNPFRPNAPPCLRSSL